MLRAVNAEMFRRSYADVFKGDERWQNLPVPDGSRFVWDEESTYIRKPTFLEGMTMTAPPPAEIRGARVLALLGDSVTTDHISPAGSIKADSPAGKYLIAKGVKPTDFNSYGARRGNHEVMVRGTFANIRLRNQMAPGTEGGWTLYQPGPEERRQGVPADPEERRQGVPGDPADGVLMTIYDASVAYQAAGTPLLVIAGKEYGSGSSRDWAAKGTLLLGVKAVIAESFERIHRSNLVNMGVLPLQFKAGESAASLKLTGTEEYALAGSGEGLTHRGEVTVTAKAVDGTTTRFTASVRIDTPEEVVAFRNGGILPYVVRQLVARA
jgi:aconitate hydratase